MLFQTNILPRYPGVRSGLVRINPLDVVSIITLSKVAYRKMVQNLGQENGKQFDRYLTGDDVVYNARIVIEPGGWASFNSTESDDSGLGIKQEK